MPLTCPCGQKQPYDVCCGPLHQGKATAATAEQLMRSRYTAFVMHDAAYLRRTWSLTTRPAAIEFDPSRRWTGLEILGTTGGTAFHTDGTVEFNAHHNTGVQHENSAFTREAGEWVYVSAL
ncbi:YchJ family protein [Kribbella jejuensis]|uniref:SEC-C motif-containing protein n=1 Tax=Kribbella jejuensis TaxID=236068 RepID=A0A542DV19_9ACTN|nr:YchJ family metal-binding protein [Kribbella jejuensis]TQJ06886.1 SEC-C motif-containing protein [Kribbella jejuensis]